MKKFRRNFIKTFFLSLPVLFLMKFDLLSSRSKKTKLKKNKNLIWYLRHDD
jgi:hypothetical protein